jgi:hypothetical protein
MLRLVPITQARWAELHELWRDQRHWRAGWAGNVYRCAADGRLLVRHRPAGLMDSTLHYSANMGHPLRSWALILPVLIPIAPGAAAYACALGLADANALWPLLVLVAGMGWAIWSSSAVCRYLTRTEIWHSGSGHHSA